MSGSGEAVSRSWPSFIRTTTTGPVRLGEALETFAVADVGLLLNTFRLSYDILGKGSFNRTSERVRPRSGRLQHWREFRPRVLSQQCVSLHVVSEKQIMAFDEHGE